MNAMFRSLRRYNYRTWFIGALISNVGQWMQMTAQSWVVLTVLTEGDAAAMGVSMALQFAPPLLLVHGGRDRLGAVRCGDNSVALHREGDAQSA